MINTKKTQRNRSVIIEVVERPVQIDTKIPSVNIMRRNAYAAMNITIVFKRISGEKTTSEPVNIISSSMVWVTMSGARKTA